MALRVTQGRGSAQWWPLIAAGQLTASMICPDCERRLSLTDHTIASDGAVFPSVVCREFHDAEPPRQACTFHEFVTLDGWSS